MLQMRRDKSVGASPLLPYTLMVVSNFLWVAYGVLRHETPILVANGTGLALGCLYFVQYLRLFWWPSPKQTQQQQQQLQQSTLLLPGTVSQHIRGIAGVVLAVIFMIVGSQRHFIPLKDPASVLGTAGVIFSIAMFASPLVALKTVIETGSARSLSLSMVMATIANNVLWGITGYWDMHDIHVSTQGAIGLLMGLIQLTLKLWYGDGTSRRLKRSSSSDKMDTAVVDQESPRAAEGDPLMELIPTQDEHISTIKHQTKPRIKTRG